MPRTACSSSASTRTGRTRSKRSPTMRGSTRSSSRCSRTRATAWPTSSAPCARREAFVLDGEQSSATGAGSTINSASAMPAARQSASDLMRRDRRGAGRQAGDDAGDRGGGLLSSAGCSETPPTGEITYTKHIAPILNEHCVRCHRDGEVAPFALTSYDEIAGWGDTIAEVVRNGRMPPWHANPEHGKFSNDARLPDADKELIYEWVKNGRRKAIRPICRRRRSSSTAGRFRSRTSSIGCRSRTTCRRRAWSSTSISRSTPTSTKTSGSGRPSAAGQPGGRAPPDSVLRAAGPGADARRRRAGQRHRHVRAGLAGDELARRLRVSHSGRFAADVPGALHAQRHASKPTTASPASCLPTPRR